MHNKKINQNTLSQTFSFLEHDVHIKTCPFHFKYQIYYLKPPQRLFRGSFINKCWALPQKGAVLIYFKYIYTYIPSFCKFENRFLRSAFENQGL